MQKKTLVIWGENDKIVSKEYAQRLQNDIQESKLQYISECGHIPHVEKPEVVAVTTEIHEDLLLKMGIDSPFGIVCLGKLNAVYENDREPMAQFYDFVN